MYINCTKFIKCKIGLPIDPSLVGYIYFILFLYVFLTIPVGYEYSEFFPPEYFIYISLPPQFFFFDDSNNV